MLDSAKLKRALGRKCIELKRLSEAIDFGLVRAEHKFSGCRLTMR